MTPLLVALFAALVLGWLGWSAFHRSSGGNVAVPADLTALAEAGDPERVREALRRAGLASASWRWAYFMGLAHVARGENARRALWPELAPAPAGSGPVPAWRQDLEDGVNLLVRAYRSAPAARGEGQAARADIARRLGAYGITLNEPRSVSLLGSPGTLLILAVLMGVFVLEAALDGFSGADMGVGGVSLATLARLGGNARLLTLQPGEWWRLFAAVLLHGGLIHLAFNAYALVLFGPAVESRAGLAGLLVVFWLTGLGGSLATAYLGSGNVISIGASGALFGLLGFTSVFGAQGLDQRFRQLLRNLPNLAILLLINGVLIPNVDNFGHAGGLVAGLALGLAYRRPGRAVESGLVLLGLLVTAAVLLKMLTAPAIPI
ncbi:MAG TPA: rhomboid family intramembrane serine protease [Deinococcales bacterium]|nr:rhomboid family intramembrane serine protease [Deinococcales bacterium]